jgi:hypothetical protein
VSAAVAKTAWQMIETSDRSAWHLTLFQSPFARRLSYIRSLNYTTIPSSRAVGCAQHGISAVKLFILSVCDHGDVPDANLYETGKRPFVELDRESFPFLKTAEKGLRHGEKSATALLSANGVAIGAFFAGKRKTRRSGTSIKCLDTDPSLRLRRSAGNLLSASFQSLSRRLIHPPIERKSPPTCSLLRWCLANGCRVD